MQTGPVAIIDGLLDGQYIPPGSKITLDGSQSFDYDDDIVLYQWTTGDGQTIGTREIMEVEFTPGPIRIDLLVKDSRRSVFDHIGQPDYWGIFADSKSNDDSAK